MQKFNFTSSESNGVLHVAISGYIDEYAELPKQCLSRGGTIELDLGASTGINSMGIRMWMSWMQQFAAAGAKLTIKELPSAMLFQCGMVKDFLPPTVKVDSVFLPVFCATCEKDLEVRVSRDTPLVAGPSGQKRLDRSVLFAKACVSPDCEIDPEYSEDKVVALLHRP